MNKKMSFIRQETMDMDYLWVDGSIDGNWFCR